MTWPFANYVPTIKTSKAEKAHLSTSRRMSQINQAKLDLNGPSTLPTAQERAEHRVKLDRLRKASI